MKKLSFSFFFVFVLVSNMFAQQATLVWSLNPPEKGAALTCPNQKVFYSANPSSASLNTAECQFRWEVIGGSFPDFNNSTSTELSSNRNIYVVWNNNSATGILKLFVERCKVAEVNFNKSFEYYIRTVSTETPTTNGNYPLQVQKGVRTVVFNIEKVKIPTTGVPGFETPIYAYSYDWSLPSDRPSWYFEGQSSTLRALPTSATSVRVVVDALTGGSVAVRGVVTVCNPNNFTRFLELPIVRTTPNTSISATPQANKITGAGVLECGITDTIVFNASLSSGLSARNYQWRFSENAAGYKFVRANGVLKDTAMTTESSVKVLVLANS